MSITKLLANPKTQALGDKLLKVDLEKGDANGRLDYVELPSLDPKTRAKVAGLMTNPADVSVLQPAPVREPAALPVAAEAPGPIRREAPRYARFQYPDEWLLNKKGLPGAAFEHFLDAYRYNPFVASETNLADPALLRAQARFLELTASEGDEIRPKTRGVRRQLLRDLRTRMTVTGLDALELAYFPAEKALSIVKRAARAAGVDAGDVLITLNGSQVRLPAWERKLGDLTAVPIRPYAGPRLPVTEAQERLNASYAADMRRERARQDEFFAHNPGASMSEYTRHVESKRANPADERFWGAMESWLRRGDLADWLPNPGGG